MTESNQQQGTGPGTPSMRKRRLVISSNLLIQVAAALAILAMLNWLSWRHYQRFDWTKSGYYGLSEKTEQVLANLKTTVTVVVFLQPSAELEYLEKVYQDVRDMLKEFQYLGQEKIQVEYVDPQRDRARAEQLIEQYQVDTANVVIFASGDRHKYVSLQDMVEFDQQPYGGGGIRVRSFGGEGAFLTAIQTVVEEESPKVYFLSGHGERDPEEFEPQRGYSTLASYLKRDNLTVAKWNLAAEQDLPSDAAALVVAGPRRSFLPAERDLLATYLQTGGRLLVMLDPREKSGLEALLQQWSVHVDENLAIARGGALFGAELLIVDALGLTYANHPITEKLDGINTSFPYARSVRAVSTSSAEGGNGPRVTELVQTPASFWGETNLDTERAVYEVDQDRAGPLNLAVAVETGKPQGVDLGVNPSRLVVIGSSSFVENATITTVPGNLDFMMNALNWLLQREQLIGVAPKLPQEFSLSMSEKQVRRVYFLTIGGMPLAVALAGLMVWMRRRQ